MNQTPLYSGATPQEVAADLAELVAFQSEGMSLGDLKALVAQKLLPHLMRYDLPYFQSMFNAFPTAESEYGGQLMLASNQGVTNWQVSPGGAMLEELCCNALCQLFGLAEGSEATFMYSGTYANQQALYMALHRFAERRGVDLGQQGVAALGDTGRLAIIVSIDAHFSVRHAVRMLGLGEQALILAPVDQQRRIDMDALRAILVGEAAGRDIVCIIATSGTTSTGSIDPLNELADLAKEAGAWLHIDGAYGYAYKLVPEWAHLFEGDERADSISWDPHKQLEAPIPSSVLFLKDGDEFRRMALHSGYFNRKEEVAPNPGLKSPPSTRPFAALPVVTILRGQGLAQTIARLRVPLQGMRDLAEYVATQPDFEAGHHPDTGIFCFRYVPAGFDPTSLNDLQRHIYDTVMARGERSISVTTLDGVTYLRLVTVAPHATSQDLIATIAYIRDIANG